MHFKETALLFASKTKTNVLEKNLIEKWASSEEAWGWGERRKFIQNVLILAFYACSMHHTLFIALFFHFLPCVRNALVMEVSTINNERLNEASKRKILWPYSSQNYFYYYEKMYWKIIWPPKTKCCECYNILNKRHCCLLQLQFFY